MEYKGSEPGVAPINIHNGATVNASKGNVGADFSN